MNLDTLKNEMIWCCQQLAERQFVANHDGNISQRLSETEFLATPTARAKGSLTPKDLLIVDINGTVLRGEGKIFSEWAWHKAIYENNPQVSSVCHAHPPFAMAMGLVHKPLGTPAIPEAIVSLGAPLVCIDGSEARTPEGIRSAVSEGLASAYAFSVSGNGVFAVGDSPEMSYLRVELMEQISRAHALAEGVGNIRKLSADWIEGLKSKRPALKPAWGDAFGASSFSSSSSSKTQSTSNAQGSSSSSSGGTQEPLLDRVRALILEELKKLNP